MAQTLMQMGKISVGIDPGKEGYIVTKVVDLFEFHPIPKIGKEVDMQALAEIFEDIAAMMNVAKVFACIEDVHAMFGSAAGSTFEFGKITGALEALLVAHKIPFTQVAPKKWQKEMWEGVPVQQKLSSTKKTIVKDTKAMSEMAAKRLFPSLDLRRTTRAKNNDDNLIDALLLCEYCSRNY